MRLEAMKPLLLAGVVGGFGTVLALDALAAAPSGRKLVAEHGWAACHGAAGQGMPAAGSPRLAGQPSAYLLSQLEAFAGGRRRNAVMQVRAKALNATEMRRIAHYYAGLETPSPAAGSTRPTLHARGREIVVNGLW